MSKPCIFFYLLLVSDESCMAVDFGAGENKLPVIWMN